jgi:hypothetical protein
MQRLYDLLVSRGDYASVLAVVNQVAPKGTPRQIKEAIARFISQGKKGGGSALAGRFIKRSAMRDLTVEERARLEQEVAGKGDIKPIQDIDMEKRVKMLRPSFFEGGTLLDTETPRDAAKERLQFAMLAHVRPGHGAKRTNPIWRANVREELRRYEDVYDMRDVHQYSTPEVTDYTTLDINGDLVRFIPPDMLSYFATPVGKARVPRSNSLTSRGIQLRDVNDTRAHLHSSQGNTTRPDLPMANLAPPTSDRAGYEMSNYVTHPPEGMLKGSIPPPMRKKVSMPLGTQAGLAFNTNPITMLPRISFVDV